MPWLAQHPDATEKDRVPEDGPEFEFGFWPPLPDIEIRSKLPVISKPEVDPLADPEGFIKQSGLSWDLCRLAVKWGVRGWAEEGGLPCTTEKVKLDGREHVVLTDESIGILRRAGLLVPVALRAIVTNLMTEEKKRAFAKSLDSSSKSLGTPVPDAIPDSPQNKTDNFPGKVLPASGEKDAPST